MQLFRFPEDWAVLPEEELLSSDGDEGSDFAFVPPLLLPDLLDFRLVLDCLVMELRLSLGREDESWSMEDTSLLLIGKDFRVLDTSFLLPIGTVLLVVMLAVIVVVMEDGDDERMAVVALLCCKCRCKNDV